MSIAAPTPYQRRLPVGAELLPNHGGASFRVWAPDHKSVTAVFTHDDAPPLSLTRENEGYFSGMSPQARGGMTYKFRLDDDPTPYPDPCSRFQPEGVHGPSQLVEPSTFKWTDSAWAGLPRAGQVLYELHVGTFTQAGTWAAATRQLPAVKDVGVTTIEVMPVPEFAGRWGWGYDGVALFAPFHHYGLPDDFRAFVDAAHGIGLGVILDVVYNHFGPDGNYLRLFSSHYFNKKHMTDWGEAINYDGEQNAGVREFFVANAVHWIAEYHLDGFRFDATQAIVDDSPQHILADITRSARQAAGGKPIYLVNENEPQDTRLVRSTEAGGYGLDALWNDDWHHAAMVALSGHNEAYYTDYFGKPQEFISAAKYGYLYQGQRYKWQAKRRGTSALDLPPTAFVHYIQNHDQIANSGRGLRAHQIGAAGDLKALTALMLLGPQTPMLFQGQEFGASSPFFYFADHTPELNKLIKAGRARELSQYPSIATEMMRPFLVDPGAPETFQRSKINHAQRSEPGPHAELFAMHRDLLALRRQQRAFSRVQRRGDLDGAVLGTDAFVLRFFAGSGGQSFSTPDDRLLIVNLGRDIVLDPAPEPLLAPPDARRWAILWTSDDPRYGGSGTAAIDTESEGWLLPGRCAVVLEPKPATHASTHTRHKITGTAQAPRERKQGE